MTRRITHFGIVVNDADSACKLWCESFGMKKAAEMRIKEEGIRSIFVSVDGTRNGMSIELMEPLDKADMSNAVARRLARKGEGFYHVCLQVDSVGGTAAALEARGMRVIRRDAVGWRGRRSLDSSSKGCERRNGRRSRGQGQPRLAVCLDRVPN